MGIYGRKSVKIWTQICTEKPIENDIFFIFFLIKVSIQTENNWKSRLHWTIIYFFKLSNVKFWRFSVKILLYDLNDRSTWADVPPVRIWMRPILLKNTNQYHASRSLLPDANNLS